MFEEVTAFIEEGDCVDIIYFDLSKAFDSVLHYQPANVLKIIPGPFFTLLHWQLLNFQTKAKETHPKSFADDNGGTKTKIFSIGTTFLRCDFRRFKLC